MSLGSTIYTIFILLIGAVLGLVGALVFIVVSLTKISKKVEDDLNKTRGISTASYEEMQKSMLKREAEHQELIKGSADKKVTTEFSKKSWVKMNKTTDDDFKPQNREKMQRSYVILKTNMLFQFQDEKTQSCKTVLCLDGYEVSTDIKKPNGRPIFKGSNPIILKKPTTSSTLTTSKEQSDSWFLIFDIGKDMEDWYLSLKKASSLGAKKDSVESKREKEFWKQLSSNLTSYQVDPAPHWITAVVCRLWWNIHNSEGFLEFVMDKLRKKLAKIKKPSVVEDIKIKEITFGPNLPILKDVKMLSVTEDGAVTVDADIIYHGGFHLTIEIDFLMSALGHSLGFPAIISVHVQNISGRLQFHSSAPPSNRFWIGFYKEPVVDLVLDTEIGPQNRSINLPQLANIIVNKIKSELIELMVLPNMEDIPIPKVKVENRGGKTVAVLENPSNSANPSPAEKREKDEKAALAAPKDFKSAEKSAAASKDAKASEKPKTSIDLKISGNYSAVSKDVTSKPDKSAEKPADKPSDKPEKTEKSEKPKKSSETKDGDVVLEDLSTKKNK